MDLDRFKQVNRDSQALLNLHHRFSHRFLIPLEFQQLHAKHDLRASNIETGRIHTALKQGIDLRKRIVARQLSLNSTPLRRPSEHHDASKVSPNQESSASLSSSIELLPVGFIHPHVATGEFNFVSLRNILVYSIENATKNVDRLWNTSKRLEELREERSTLRREIALLKYKVQLSLRADAESRMVSCKSRGKALSRRSQELIEGISRLAEVWTDGVNENGQCSSPLVTLQSLMNAYYLKGDKGWVRIQSHSLLAFKEYLIRIGLVVESPTDQSRYRLKLRIK